MGSPLELTPIEKGIKPGEGFPEVQIDVDINDLSSDHLSQVASQNTQTEISGGKGENKAYKTFSLRGFLDGLRVTGKNFGEQTDEMKAEERKLQEETGVTLQENRVENPFEENGEAIVGSVTMPSINDLHMSTKPLESNRTYTISQKDNDAKWYEFKHVGYKIIRWVEKGIYKWSEGFNGGNIREVGFQRFMEILPEVLECEGDKLVELSEKIKTDKGDDGIFKYAWNRAIIFRAKWNNEEEREGLKNVLSDEDKKTARERVSITVFREQKIWDIRNQLIKIFVPDLLKKHLGNTEDTTLIAVDGGDPAHDGGVLEDHRSVRSLLLNTFKNVPAVKKFLASIGGNHDQDAREPKALLETLNYYGERIFYQHVNPKVEVGKKNLIVGLNTFIMSEQWGEVLDAYLDKNEENLTTEQLKDLRDKRESMLNNQQKIFEEMANFDGNCIVIHAHNSRRLIEYMERKKISFKPNVQIKIISGHTHEDGNHRALVDKPVDLPIGTFRKEFIEVYKSSGFIIINGKKIRLPKGLLTLIDEKGDVNVKSLEFNEEEKEKVSKQLETEVY